MHSLILIICIYITVIYADLILDDDTTWRDDFAYDSLGETGWNIHQISGYPIPTTNPMVIISNQPKYHGPFPSSYVLQRYVTCNTRYNTRLFITFLTSYCNTDKKNDNILFTIIDTTNISTMPIFAKNKLNNKNKLLNEKDLLFIRNTTANYYTNHSSSNSFIPQCCVTSKWYTSNIYNTYQLTVIGENKYKIIINILTSDKDEYVLISDIAILCIQIPMLTDFIKINTQTPTINPSEIDRKNDEIFTTISDMIEENLGVNHEMKSILMHFLWYIMCIMLIIICCSLGVFIACFISIKRQLNGLNGVKVKDDNYNGFHDKVVVFMMDLVRTNDDDNNTNNSDRELIQLHNSNVASIEEGNVDYSNNSSFKINSKKRDRKLNDDACSEIGSEHTQLQTINDVFVSDTK